MATRSAASISKPASTPTLPAATTYRERERHTWIEDGVRDIELEGDVEGVIERGSQE